MRVIRYISAITLAIGLLGTSANLFAHESGSSGSMDEFMVTRHFTGAWNQVNQQNQGLSLEVIEQANGSRRSVAYWFTYGKDRKPAWYIGIGDLIDDRIEFELYESTDVGFMQAKDPGSNPVSSIGTMTIVFDDCDGGVVTFETGHEEVGSGSFDIERLTEVMNTQCSGGISDDMHADAMFGEQRMELISARDGMTGSGHARYEDYPGHMEFDVEVEGLPDGDYHLFVGMRDQGVVSVNGGRGKMEFSSPGETGIKMMTFDPRGMQIEIHDATGVVLSSFDNTFEEDGRGHNGDGSGNHGDHDNQCGSGSGEGMGGGMRDCVDDGEYIEIEIDLENTAVLPDAKGKAEWDMNTNRIAFSVEIEDVPVGSYTLKVGGVEVGTIEAFEMMHGDEVYGHIQFRDPENNSREHLNFEPRGKMIEVLQGNTVILNVEFPEE